VLFACYEQDLVVEDFVDFADAALDLDVVDFADVDFAEQLLVHLPPQDFVLLLPLVISLAFEEVSATLFVCCFLPNIISPFM